MNRLRKFLIIMILLFTYKCSFVYASDFEITSQEAVLYNMNDDKIIYELNKDERVPIASLTKIMTTIIALENIDNLEEKITLTSDVFTGLDGYSKAGFQVGEVVTYRDLLYGIMLPSGADAVNAIVINTTGELDKFISLMNEKAKTLGLSNTHFDNAIGMDSELIEIEDEEKIKEELGNYSTAQDIALLLKYALKNDTFKEIFTTKKYTVSSTKLELKSTLTTYSTYSNIDISHILGAKSGFTDGAGLCLASIATMDGVNYLLVTLGASTTNRSNAIRDSVTIYDYYSSNYSYIEVIEKEKWITSIPVKWGKLKEYIIKSPESIEMYLKNDIELDKITYQYDGIDELSNKVKKKDKLGTVQIMYKSNVLTYFDVYLNEDLEYYHPVIYSIVILGMVILLFLILKVKKKHQKRRRKRKMK